MQPKILDSDSITLMGFSFFADPFAFSGGGTEENEIGQLWKRFIRFLMESKQEIKHIVNDQVLYEVHIQHPDT